MSLKVWLVLAHSIVQCWSTSRLSSLQSTSESNRSKVWRRQGRTLGGVHGSEHAHFVSKWCPTTNLATECAEKLREEYLMLCWNEGITDMGFIRWSWFMFKLKWKVKAVSKWKNNHWDFTNFYTSGTDIHKCFHEWFRYKICWRLWLWRLENLKVYLIWYF